MEKLKNIKIVFIDIDGTLVNTRKHITLRTRKSIAKLVNKGIYVVLVSGRGVFHCVDKSKRALASPLVISSNGAEIYDYENNKYLYSSKIEEEKIEKIWKYCSKNKVGLMINSENGKYINKYLIGKDKKNGILITSLKELKKLFICQIVFISNNIEKIIKIRDYVSYLELNVSNCSESFFEDKISDRYRLDVNNIGVSKGSGIIQILSILNIKKEESLCFGDYLNDIEMFMESGFKVAMENACDELKKCADFVTTSNDKNGVANFLNKYL